VLAIDAVSVRRGSTLTLHNISLNVAAGSTVAVVGESGAGKSTLIAAVLGLVAIRKGSITWNGGPVRECRPALVMQEPRAAFNPALTLRRSVLESGWSYQLNYLTGDPVRSLSDKRNGLVFCAHLSQSLRWFCLMNPSALDAVTQKYTAKLIADLQSERGFASLIVTHDLGYAAAYGDEIAVLRAGHIEEVTRSHNFGLYAA